MKKLFTFCLVLILSLGLSVSAWASDDNTELGTITISGATRSGSTFTIPAGQAGTNFTLNVGTADPNATITAISGPSVSGNPIIGSNSGSATLNIAVPSAGTNTSTNISITIVAENNTDTEVHTFTIERQAQQVLDGDHGLSSPTLRATNASGAVMTLSGSTFAIPPANANTATFHLTATASGANATITAISASGTNVTASGIQNINTRTATATINIPAATATANLSITVRAQNGDEATHNFTITRQQQAVPSTLTNLTGIVTGGAALTRTPATFANNVVPNNITLTVPAGANDLTLTATRANTAATITTSGVPANLTVGAPTGAAAAQTLRITGTALSNLTAGQSLSFNIVVAGQGSANTTYTITLQRAGATTGATLSSLTSTARAGNTNLTPTLTASPAFRANDASGTHNYTFTVPTNATNVVFNWATAATNQVRIQNATNAGNINVAWPTGTAVGPRTVTAQFPSGTNSASFRIEVRANATAPVTVYTINLQRAGTGTNASHLDGLAVRNTQTTSTASRYLLDINPSFSSTRTNYTLSVPFDQEFIYLYPTARDPQNTSISVSGGHSRTDSWSNNRTNGFFRVRLNTGSNNIRMTVQSGGQTTHYDIVVTRSDNVVRNASLNSLHISRNSTSTSGGNLHSLSPSFSWDITRYNVNIPNNNTEAFVHFTLNTNNANTTVRNATRVSTGVYRVDLSGNTRSRNVEIVVTNGNNSTTYTVVVARGGTALLNGLIVSRAQNTSSGNVFSLSPSFNAQNNNYFVTIPAENNDNTRNFYVQATLQNSGDTLRIGGSTINSATWRNFTVNPGDTRTVAIEVNDGSANTYNLTVYAIPRNANNNADLRDLDIRLGTSGSNSLNLSPGFSASTISYTATVANDISTVRVFPDTSDRNALVFVNDVFVDGSNVSVDLAEGNNDISVRVVAENGSTTRTYTVRITRGASGSGVSTLSGLEVRTGHNQLMLSTVPVFNPNTTSYTVNVPDDVTSINFRPTATDSGATISIQGTNVSSGSWSTAYSVNPGNANNTFHITVTASNGSTTTYTINVVRGLNIVVSNQNLTVNGTSITTAAFNINGNNYFKLRDIAYALRGTQRRINVTYNPITRVVSIISGQDYVPIGGEMVRPSGFRNARLSNQALTFNGNSINIPAYNIDGYNFFMLRDLGSLLNMSVEYNEATRTMMIDTSRNFTN